MNWRPYKLLACTAALLAFSHAVADTLPRITPRQAYAEIERTGELRHMHIDGDLDVAKMKPPAGAMRIVLRGVRVAGRLHSGAGGPRVALLIIDQSEIRDIDLRGTRWSAPLAIENSSVQNRVRFDDAQFDAAFTIHASSFNGPTQFPRVRFAGAVEITSSTFRPAAPLRAATTFTDTRFAAPARFDRSEFASVRFNSARFEADATFIGLKVTDQASWRNVIFGADAEFRFCRLGHADFGDAEQMSVFTRLADFRGCRMAALQLDYVDARGNMLLVNVQIEPGDLSLKQASLRGERNDFSGLDVAGKIDLNGAQIENLRVQWHQISPALLRSAPDSSVLRPIQRRLQALEQDDEALHASALLAERVIDERLARTDASFGDRALLWTERIVWGGGTGYGTRLDRILIVALASWLLLALPLAFAGVAGKRSADGAARNGAADAGAAAGAQSPAADTVAAGRRSWAYAFSLMFKPSLGMRPPARLSKAWRAYLWFVRAVGLLLLALIALTLAKVSPVVQAVIGQIVR